jgi:hypothetical protein
MQYAWVAARRPDLYPSRLDVEYARDADGSMRSPNDRRQVFENAKNRGQCLPADVLMRVEADPVTQGLMAISESYFWELLAKPPSERRLANKLVDNCLERLGLVRLPVGFEELWVTDQTRDSAQITSADNRFADKALGQYQIENVVTAHKNNFDSVALLGALYREACLSFEPEAASYLGIRFWVHLEDFLSKAEFRDIADELRDFAVNHVVYDRDEERARMGFSSFEPDRLPGTGIGLLLPASDPEVKALMKRVTCPTGTSL